jgi:ATP-dependent helicase YprA (DUF1998 family)
MTKSPERSRVDYREGVLRSPHRQEKDMTFSSRYALALCLCLPGAAVAQQIQEPETPNLHDTVEYINANTQNGVSLVGTVLTANNEKWQRQVDLLNVTPLSATSGDDASAVTILCNGSIKCVHTVYRGHPDANGNTSAGNDVTLMEVQCKNATIAPHVANAINHLVRLIQQRVAASQPF